MSTISKLDVKELKELIIAFREEVRGDIKGIREDITRLELSQADLKGRLTSIENSTQNIPDMAERVGELKNWKQIGLTLFGAFIGGLITYLVSVNSYQ